MITQRPKPIQIKESTEPLVERVTRVFRFERGDPTFTLSGLSEYEYVFQCTVSGRCWHEVSGRGIEMARGLALWLDEMEHHRVEVTQAPWVFYSVLFLTSVPPPPIEHRIRRVPSAMAKKFGALWKLWNNASFPSHIRELRVRWQFEMLLHDFLQAPIVKTIEPQPHTRLWWQLHTQIGHNLAQNYRLATLEQMTKFNHNIITRSCRAAVGLSPMKAIKRIRMTAAYSFVTRTDLAIKEIATRVGYARVHEFSRDYRKFWGYSPRNHRQRRSLPPRYANIGLTTPPNTSVSRKSRPPKR